MYFRLMHFSLEELIIKKNYPDVKIYYTHAFYLLGKDSQHLYRIPKVKRSIDQRKGMKVENYLMITTLLIQPEIIEVE